MDGEELRQDDDWLITDTAMMGEQGFYYTEDTINMRKGDEAESDSVSSRSEGQSV